MAEYNPSKIIKDGNTYNFRDTTKIPLAGSNKISGDLIPSTDGTVNLGSLSYQWDQAYIKSLTINGVACGDILTHNASEFVNVSGNQTIAGVKSFSANTYITSLNFTNEVASPSSSNSAVLPLIATITYTDQSTPQSARLNFRITANGDKSLYPQENNQYSLGVSSKRWTTLYGYFASLGGTYLGNEISTNERTNLYLLANRDIDGQSGAYIGRFRQNRAQGAMSDDDVSFVSFDFLENSTRYTRCFTMGLTDWDSNGVPQTYYITAPNGKGSLGTSTNKWKSFNGINPGALSLPGSYVNVDTTNWALDGSAVNVFTPTSDGWLGIQGVDSVYDQMHYIFIGRNDSASYHSQNMLSPINGLWSKSYHGCVFIPVVKNTRYDIRCICDSVVATFYPCQGNV